MSRRKLTQDEVALWRKVADATQRLHPERTRHELPHPKPKPTKAPHPHRPDFQIGARSAVWMPGHDLMPGISDRMARQPVQMDRKKFGKMKRGKVLPEGRIDLHGMTTDQAHPALTGFILRAQAEGKRLVLVITGKGKTRPDDGPIPTRRGVLKHQVPQWLSLPPLRSAVLQVAEAHVRHGGSGAYYVYLRRR